MSGHHRAAEESSPVRRYVLLAVALIVALLAALWFFRPSHDSPVVRPTPVVEDPSRHPTPAPKADPCASQASSEFAPSRVTVPGVFANAPVLALGRDSKNVPSVPPVTETGKREVAWDRPPGIMPGAPNGNVLLNVHTWPNGTALGNQLLNGLEIGGRIIVKNGADVLCYRGERRTQVPTATLIPALYDTSGPPELVIIACSGKRLGPGNWTQRTLWYAVPESAPATAS